MGGILPPNRPAGGCYYADKPQPAFGLRTVITAILPLAALATAACTALPGPNAIDRLRPCTADEGPADAYCGSLDVYENREARQGRRIALKIIVLPALGTAEPDPLVFLAGGPGQGAARMAQAVREMFRPILRERDIVLVDQRGTGASNPLECRTPTDSLSGLTESDDAVLARLKKCLEGYDADVRLYTTPIAMDDLDEVRAYLGYNRVNLYGGSYGTRAALVYLRRHGDRVRSMVLDGVAPMDMQLPLFVARDAQRALDRLLADCDRDPTCRAAQPDLSSRVRRLLERLERSPAKVRLTHPRTGIPEEVTIEARVVASVLFGALYNPVTASLVPTLLARAEQDDFQALLALALANEGVEENMSLGMQLSVVCSEDAPRVTTASYQREGEGTVFGGYLLSSQLEACAIWPRGTIDPSYYEPVVSDVPSLVLSGDLDPVTPPGWGESVARHLTRARHITMPATGHGVIGTPCGAKLVKEFIEEGSADDLDTSCVETVKRPPFFLTPAGPDPAPRSAGAADRTGAAR